ncbi:MAG: CaiB/BaiF CoA-transferase family protein [Gammaproteobacteria bacterium]|nr:CaiB/BaiF CoA-transferase family protein [Gammaproteobacteria bacterium]
MGPLAGLKVIELAGIGPGPFCAMLLSDMGAEVLRIDRIQDAGLGIPTEPRFNLLARGRRSLALDLKSERGVAAALRLVEQADALIEGFRPGVMERLGLGPDACLERNPRLVYGRVTGWGQDGPLAAAAGHDLNYIAISGVLGCIGAAGQKPVPPLNLVGDFGGGAMFLAFGMVCALLEARRSGKGQIVDAAMAEGAAYLLTPIYALHAAGIWQERRGANLLDGGAPYYDVYQTADGGYVAVAPIEAKFYAELLERLGLDPASLPAQNDRAGWDTLRDRLAGIFKQRTRDEWCEQLEGTDVCFAPVVGLSEAHRHPHNAARKAFVERDGVVQPAPAPRFSRTQAAIQGPPPAPGADSTDALAAWGFPAAEIDALVADGVVLQR